MQGRGDVRPSVTSSVRDAVNVLGFAAAALSLSFCYHDYAPGQIVGYRSCSSRRDSTAKYGKKRHYCTEYWCWRAAGTRRGDRDSVVYGRGSRINESHLRKHLEGLILSFATNECLFTIVEGGVSVGDFNIVQPLDFQHSSTKLQVQSSS